MSTANSISIAVAAAALAWTIIRDIANRRALSRERRVREIALAREEKRREEEVALLREQIGREAGADRAERAATLIGESSGFSGSSHGVSFPVAVRNAGPAVARNISIWLALEHVGPVTAEAATVVTQKHAIGALAPQDEPAKFSLEQQGASAGGGAPRDGQIIASWTDGNGDHVEAIGKLAVFM